MPPVPAAARLALRARTELLEMARLAVLPVRRLADERFVGDAPALLLAGNALHADVSPEAPPSALLGCMLVGLAQTVGYPVPVGGSGRSPLRSSLVSPRGRRGRCLQPVERVLTSGGRATGVTTAAGEVSAHPSSARRLRRAAPLRHPRRRRSLSPDVRGRIASFRACPTRRSRSTGPSTRQRRGPIRTLPTRAPCTSPTASTSSTDHICTARHRPGAPPIRSCSSAR